MPYWSAADRGVGGGALRAQPAATAAWHADTPPPPPPCLPATGEWEWVQAAWRCSRAAQLELPGARVGWAAWWCSRRVKLASFASREGPLNCGGMLVGDEDHPAPEAAAPAGGRCRASADSPKPFPRAGGLPGARACVPPFVQVRKQVRKMRANPAAPGGVGLQPPRLPQVRHSRRAHADTATSATAPRSLAASPRRIPAPAARRSRAAALTHRPAPPAPQP